MKDTFDLKQKAFTGVLWSFTNHFGIQLVSLIPSMVLARLLTPTEYGLIAMASIFNGIAFQLSTGGFSDALLQRKEIDHLDCCSVYYFNLAINTTLYFIFFLLAPYCAVFMNEPRVINVMRVSLLSLPLTALGGVHAILLKRELNFKAPAIRNFIVQIISAIIAIILAFLGCGVWALVVQGVLQTMGNNIINWILYKWRPTLAFSFKRLRNMFSYGVKIYLSGIINYTFNKSIDTTIAKVYTPADLSYYNRAYSTANLFINTFVGILNNVAFPVFSRIQDNPRRICTSISKFIRIVTLVTFFIIGFISVLAEPIFNFIYSSKWNAVIPYFLIVCIWGLFQPIHSVIENVLRSTGCAGIIMYNRIFSKMLVVANAIIAWKLGITFMLWGAVIIEIIQIFVFTYFTKKFYKYSIYDVLKDVLPNSIPALLVAIILTITDNLFKYCVSISTEMLDSFLRLGIAFIIAIVSFVIINKFLKLNSYKEVISIIMSRIEGRNKRLSIYLNKILVE